VVGRSVTATELLRQWEEVGPFATDPWQYVFGNRGVLDRIGIEEDGLEVSSGGSRYGSRPVWLYGAGKFADFRSVRPGLGRNMAHKTNSFVRLRRQGVTSIASVPKTADSNFSLDRERFAAWGLRKRLLGIRYHSHFTGSPQWNLTEA